MPTQCLHSSTSSMVPVIYLARIPGKSFTLGSSDFFFMSSSASLGRSVPGRRIDARYSSMAEWVVAPFGAYRAFKPSFQNLTASAGLPLHHAAIPAKLNKPSDLALDLASASCRYCAASPYSPAHINAIAYRAAESSFLSARYLSLSSAKAKEGSPFRRCSHGRLNQLL